MNERGNRTLSTPTRCCNKRRYMWPIDKDWISGALRIGQQRNTKYRLDSKRFHNKEVNDR